MTKTFDLILLSALFVFYLPQAEIRGDLIVASDISGNRLLTIDTSTGAGSQLAMLPNSSIYALSFDPNGKLFGVDVISDKLVQINPRTGNFSEIGSLGYDFVQALAFSPTGELYGVDTISKQLLQIDPETGMGSAIAAMEYPIFGLDFDSSGTLFGAQRQALGGQLITNDLVRINTINGHAEVVGNFNDGNFGLDPSITGLVFDSSDQLFGSDLAPTPERFVSIDTQTGNASVIGDIGYYNIQGLAFGKVASVPEPYVFPPLVLFMVLTLSCIHKKKTLNQKSKPLLDFHLK